MILVDISLYRSSHFPFFCQILDTDKLGSGVLNPLSFGIVDLDERILKQQQEEEERKRQRKEKKKEKKVSTQHTHTCLEYIHVLCIIDSTSFNKFLYLQKEKAAEEEPEVDPDVAAMMGFGGFRSNKN